MKYVRRDRDLKSLGYKFQLEPPLMRKVYTKKIGSYNISLYVAGRDIVIDDWGSQIRTVLEFFRIHRTDPKFDVCIPGTTRPKGYVRIQKNIYSGTVQFYDQEFYNACLQTNDMETWNNRYGAYREIVLYKKDMDSLLIEIQNISN